MTDNFFAASVAGFSPGQPNPGGEAAIPHDWNTVATTDFLLWGMNRARWAEHLKRICRHSLSLSVGDPYNYNLTFDFNLDRLMMDGQLVDESKIRRPGIAASVGDPAPNGPYKYTGLITVTGFDDEEENEATAEVTFYVGSRQTIGNDPDTQVYVPHLLVNGAGLYTPSFLLQATILYNTTAAEFAYTVRSYTHPDEVVGPDLLGSGSFAPAHGGGDFPLRVFSDSGSEATSASVNISPIRWLSWGGAWNVNTGARLIP